MSLESTYFLGLERGAMGGRRPLLADGSIVGDYEPLFKYWEKAKKRGRGEEGNVVLRGEDFEKLEQLLRDSEGRISLADALEELALYFVSRVDPELAREAVEEAYGVAGYDSESARRIIARILAGWLIEAAKTWGTLRLRG